MSDKHKKHDHTYDNGYAVLTDLEIEDIRFRHSQGERQVDLAKAYGVSRENIYNFVHFRRRRPK